MKRTALLLLFITAALTATGGPLDRRSAWREFTSREGIKWNVTFRKDESIRALYGQGIRAAKTAREAANRILHDYPSVFRIDNVSDLKLQRIEESETGTHIYYQQHFSGIPVEGGEVNFHLDRNHRLIAASSNFQPGLHKDKTLIASPDAAQKQAIRYFGGAAVGGIPQLRILSAGTSAVPVWRMEVYPDSLAEGARIMYVDASDPRIVLRVRRAYADAEGKGTIFTENPVVTPERSSQKFKYMDGSRSLSGNFVKTYNANSELFFTGFADPDSFTTASDPNRNYTYEVSDSRFSEAMAYFHINKVHDQWRSFGFNKLNFRFPIFVNVVTRDGDGFDNAFYTRRAGRFAKGVIVMGSGDRLENLGHDADVYYHEYGHAVLDHAKPSFFDAVETNYGFAFHEGFGDISAAAITGNPKLAEFGLKLKTGRFIGRNLENNNRYPQNVPLPGFGRSEPHHTGLIVGGTWWELQKSIGANQAQRILYRSLPMLPSEMTFFDWRDSMLAADRVLNGGSNAAALQSVFERRGLGGSDPGQTGSVRVTTLKTARLNTDSGSLKMQSSFDKGDIIIALANYVGKGLVPGYNLIAVRIDLKGPADSSIFAFGFPDEVTNGNRTGRNAAWQVEIITDTATKSGTYTLTLQSILGGTTQMTDVRSVKFKIR